MTIYFLFAVTISPTAASAEVSAEFIIEGLQSSTEENRETAMIHLKAIETGFRWANADALYTGGQAAYCQPEALDLNAQQIASIFEGFMKTNPQNDEYPTGLILLQALKTAFPCE